VPRLHARYRQGDLGDGGEVLAERRVGGRDDLARPQHRQFIVQRLPSIRADVLRRGELAGGQIEQRHARAVGAGCDRQQEGWLACVEVAGVEQRAGREHPHDLALDDALGPARVLHLLADGDAIAFADQPREVCVERVIGEAAHRDGAARRILRSGGQRELEGTRGHQRILVEHLVEVAHAEEDDGAGVLALRVLVLAHRGRQGCACTRRRGHAGFGRYRHSSVRRVKAGPARGRVPAGAIRAGVRQV
jgi:hypothetical protein